MFDDLIEAVGSGFGGAEIDKIHGGKSNDGVLPPVGKVQLCILTVGSGIYGGFGYRGKLVRDGAGYTCTKRWCVPGIHLERFSLCKCIRKWRGVVYNRQSSTYRSCSSYNLRITLARLPCS